MVRKKTKIASVLRGETLENFLKNHHFIPEPTILYRVGDRVIIGNVKLSHVTEVHEGGKVLLLHQTVTEHNYGHPYDVERDMYVAWHDVSPYRTWEDSERLKTKKKLYFHAFQTEMRGLLGKVYYFGVDFSPEYQRDLVWTPSDKVALIESIFEDVDIGKFMFRKLPFKSKSPAYEIVDGKQRLTALMEFYEGRFTWKNRTYHNLHPMDRIHFDCHMVTLGELPEETTEKQVLECFIKLNTTGRPQDPKHLEQIKKLLEKHED